MPFDFWHVEKERNYLLLLLDAVMAFPVFPFCLCSSSYWDFSLILWMCDQVLRKLNCRDLRDPKWGVSSLNEKPAWETHRLWNRPLSLVLLFPLAVTTWFCWKALLQSPFGGPLLGRMKYILFLQVNVHIHAVHDKVMHQNFSRNIVWWIKCFCPWKFTCWNLNSQCDGIKRWEPWGGN